MLSEAMAWRVTWQGKTKFFEKMAAAQAYADRYRDATIEAAEVPEGTKVEGRESRPPPKSVIEAILRGEMPPGDHAHPHEKDGEHRHDGLPAGGGHEHNPDERGGHRHRPEDPVEGFHLNVGPGIHDHLLAKDLGDYVNWVVDQHHPAHKWLAGHKKTWIKHDGEQEFREAESRDWFEHTLWHMHSAGVAMPEAHGEVFLDPDTRFIEKEYEFEDGTRRPATLGDFRLEFEWFLQNTPEPIARRVQEACPAYGDALAYMKAAAPAPAKAYHVPKMQGRSDIEIMALHSWIHRETQKPAETTGWDAGQRETYHGPIISEIKSRGLENRISDEEGVLECLKKNGRC